MNNTSKLTIASIATVALLAGAAVPALAAVHMRSSNVQRSGVSEETKAASYSNRQARVADKLDRAVQSGKITADQKAQIIAKLAEMHSYRMSLKDLPQPERKQAIKSKKAELKQWAIDNGINLRMFAGGHK